MTDVIDFDKERRRRVSDGHMMPRDLLVQMIEDIDAGRINPLRLLIRGVQAHSVIEGAEEHISYNGNADYSQAVAILSVSLHMQIRDWIL